MPSKSPSTASRKQTDKHSARSANATEIPPFGELIKFWRSTLGYSQQQLAAKLETTPRHISFLETGRSQPQAEMVSRLSEALELDEQGHITLLSAAGLQSPHEPIDLGLAEYAELRSELSLALSYHDPFPALLVDQLGDIALVNRAWLSLLGIGGPLQLQLPDKANLLDMYFAAAGIRQHIRNWEQFACVVLLRAREQQILTGNQRIGKLIEWLQAYEGVPEDWALRARESSARGDSNYQFSLAIGERELSWRVVVLGAEPLRSNAAPSLLMHQFFPADRATAEFFRANMQRLPAEDYHHPLLCEYQADTVL